MSLTSKASGTAVSSYTTDLIAAKTDMTPEEEHAIKWSAASLYGGGADTVRFFFAFVCNPLTLIVLSLCPQSTLFSLP